jgi:hypothetical protein
MFERKLRRYYQLASFSFRRDRESEFHIDPYAKILTPWEWAGVPVEPGELFFGYYDKSPWSSDGERMLFHFLRGRGNRQIEIMIFDRRTSTCQMMGKSTAWNFQQGAMTQWLRGRSDDRIIFNDIVENMLVARIVSIDGREESVVSFPIQTVHPNGREALTLNYERLSKLRPEYGYSLRVKNFAADQRLENDGIWRVDLWSGKGELILTLAELLANMPRREMNPAKTKVNHIIASPTGKRCVFMHRWFSSEGKCSRLYAMNWDGTNRNLLLDNQMVSHYCWFDDDHLIVYGRTPTDGDKYFSMDVETGLSKAVGQGCLENFGDGHPSCSPDRRWIVTDTYFDRRFQQQLLLYKMSGNEVRVVGRFLHPPKFFGAKRCDLHPRWSPDGRKISIDSVAKGFRSSYIVDVSSIVDTSLS